MKLASALRLRALEEGCESNIYAGFPKRRRSGQLNILHPLRVAGTASWYAEG
jgi:hypothetical protein